MTVEVTVVPSAPAPGDGILITVKGAVPEGSRVRVTSTGDQLLESPAFGLGEVPENTGPDARRLQVTGGTSGTFKLTVIDPDTGDSSESDPIYYSNDAPTYHYPDVDTVVEALEDIVPEDVEVSASRNGAPIVILFGGKWSGKDVAMTVTSASIGGSETTSATDVTVDGGPFVFGPNYLGEGDYEIDVVNSSDVSLLTATVDLAVEA